MILANPKEFLFKYKKQIYAIAGMNVLLAVTMHESETISLESLNLFIMLTMIEMVTIVIIYLYSDQKTHISELLPFVVYDIETKSHIYSAPLSRITKQNILKKTISLDDNSKIDIRRILLQISNKMSEEPSPKAFQDGLLKLEEKFYKLSFSHDGNRSIFITLHNCDRLMKKLEDLEKSYEEAANKESYMSKILDNIPIAVWARNKDSEIIYFNKIYSNITLGGVERHDKSKIEIDRKAKSYAERALKEQSILKSERPIIIGGNRFIYQFNDVPSSEEDVVVTAAWNITETEALRDKIKQYTFTNKYLLDSISYGCMIVGPDKRLTYFNEPLMKIWNIDPTLLYSNPRHEEILDALYSVNILPAQVNFENFKKSRSELIDNITEPIEDLFYLPDGQCIRSVAIPYENNCVLFTYENVTTQLKLQRLNRSLRSIQQFTLDRLQEGVCIFNDSGILELMNAGMAKIWNTTIPDEDTAYSTNDFINTCQNEASKDSKLDIKKFFDKTVVSKMVASHVIKNADGKTLYRTISPMPDRTLIISDLDITESMSVRKALAEQNQALMDLDKVRSEFIGQMSNKLRGILNSIRGTYKLLLSKNSSNLTEEQRNFISNLAESGDYLAKILFETDDMVNLGEVYNQAPPKEFDIAVSIKNVVKKYNNILEKNKIKLKLNIEQSSLPYKGDQGQFEKAISQYLSNSIIRLGSEGKIEIKATALKDKITITIEDNGISIEENADELSYMGSVLANAIIDMMNGLTTRHYADKNSTSTTKIILSASEETAKLLPSK